MGVVCPSNGYRRPRPPPLPQHSAAHLPWPQYNRQNGLHLGPLSLLTHHRLHGLPLHSLSRHTQILPDSPNRIALLCHLPLSPRQHHRGHRQVRRPLHHWHMAHLHIPCPLLDLLRLQFHQQRRRIQCTIYEPKSEDTGYDAGLGSANFSFHAVWHDRCGRGTSAAAPPSCAYDCGRDDGAGTGDVGEYIHVCELRAPHGPVWVPECRQ